MEETKVEYGKKREEEKKEKKEEAKQGEKSVAPAEEKKTKGSKDGQESKEEYPLLFQEITFEVNMHCKACASDVHSCLKGFEGVEDVMTDINNNKVVVKGKIADPSKVLEKIKKETNKQGKLLTAIPKPPAPKKKNEKRTIESSQGTKSRQQLQHNQHTRGSSALDFLSMSAATTRELSLTLVVDSKGQRVLFAEAGLDLVDFLFSIMSLPIGTVVRLLNKESMVGSLGNLYESIENLSDFYMQPFQDKDARLKPEVLASGATKLPHIESSNDSKHESFYRCSGRSYISEDPEATCPEFGHCNMSYQEELVETDQKKASDYPLSSSCSNSSSAECEGGYVKGVVTYMVMDDLKVELSSPTSTIDVLGRCNVKDVRGIEKKTVKIGKDEALKLLKASMQSKTVLTDVFLATISSVQ